MTLPLNDRGSVTGRPGDSNSFAPLAPVGIHISNRHGPRANNGAFWANPWATADQRVTGVRDSWPDWFGDTFGPWSDWLEGPGTFWSGLYVIEGPFGSDGDYRRYFALDGMERAKRSHKWHLIDGFHDGLKVYTESGSKVVVHDGSLEQGRLAEGRSTFAQKAELYRIVREHDELLIAAGCDIGHDALTGYDEKSLSYARFLYLKRLGVSQQIEATLGGTSPKEYVGCACMTNYANFINWHVAPQQPIAVTWKMPLVSSPDFAKLMGELRVHIEITTFLATKEETDALVYGTPEEKVAPLATIAKGCRDMIAMNPRIRPLLDFSLAVFSIQAGVKAATFWGEP